MAERVSFTGWLRYSNSGRAYRKWLFLVGDEEVDVGDSISDVGPDRADRFHFHEQGSKTVIDEERAAALLGFRIPPWDPPAAAAPEVLLELKAIYNSLQGNAKITMAAVRAMTDDQSQDRSIVAGVFRLRGYYKYDSGGPYRIWTLERDVPELAASTAWTTEFSGPPHAITGDELWEDREDRGAVFRLKRDDLIIARPEWWQVRELFGGSWPGWASAATAVAPTRSGSKATPSAANDPARPAWLRDFSEYRLLLMPDEIAGTPVVGGDVLWFDSMRKKSKRPPHGVRMIPVPRSSFPSILAAFPHAIPIRPLHEAPHWTADGIRTSVANSLERSLRKAHRSNPSSTPLVALRSLIAPVSAPITAQSDDAAIFELLYQISREER